MGMIQNQSNSLNSNFLHLSQNKNNTSIEKNNNLYLVKKDVPLDKEDKDDKVLFEFHGLKIHFDDILIVGLLFLLYKEEDKDYLLLIALGMLLFS